MPHADRDVDGSDSRPVLIGVRTAYILCASVLAVAAHLMGASWLGAGFLGIPVGMWLIGAGFAFVAMRQDPTISSRVSDSIDRLGESVSSMGGSAADAVAGVVSHDESAVRESSITRPVRHDARRRSVTPGVSPIRVGIDLTRAEAGVLMGHEAASPHQDIEWIPLNGSSAGIGDLDGLIARDEAGVACIVIPERARRDIVWPDWGEPLPLSYAGVFPSRFDPVRVTLTGVDLESVDDARLVSLMVETAARSARAKCVGSRAKARGRGAMDEERVGRAIGRIGDQLMQLDEGDRLSETPTTRAAARLVSAWAAGADEHCVSPAYRRRLLGLCDRLLPDEPASTLRLAAGQFAAYADNDGLNTLLRAQRNLIGAELPEVDEPTAFVFSEIMLGVETPLTLGRVAAGICLLWAMTPEEQMPHIRDDLLDELRYAGWLIGRDQDHHLLRVVIRTLERARETHDTLWAMAA